MSVHIKFAWTLLGTIIFAIATITANAGSLEDAIAADARGDYATAMRLLRPLAEQGNADAQESLGKIYKWGKGVPQDKAEAAKWYAKAAEGYREAAERGNSDAQWLRFVRNLRKQGLSSETGKRDGVSRVASGSRFTCLPNLDVH
jgi:hypothetical protein